MGIIQFLLDNLFLVVIIVAFLSSLWAKKKQEDTKQERARQHPSQQTATPTKIGEYHLPTTVESQPEYRIDMPQPMNRERQEPVLYEGTIQPQDNKLVKKDAIDEINTPSSLHQNRKLNVQKKQSTTTAAATMSSISLVDEPLSKKAVEGMMWAEVFGPPRSKNPFRGGSYRK